MAEGAVGNLEDAVLSIGYSGAANLRRIKTERAVGDVDGATEAVMNAAACVSSVAAERAAQNIQRTRVVVEHTATVTAAAIAVRDRNSRDGHHSGGRDIQIEDAVGVIA